ncbi:hypothetical protein L9F63_022462, partial [Diploptera punctata]
LVHGAVYNYDSGLSDLLGPATSWYSFWMHDPTEQLVLYLPPELLQPQGRDPYGRGLDQRPEQHKERHFGYSRYN